MKNDVVRWNGQQNINNSSNNNSSNSSSNSSSSGSSSGNNHRSKHSQHRRNINNNEQSVQHVASRRTIESRAAVADVAPWQQLSQQQQQQQQQLQTINECDIKNLNFNCNLFKTSFLTKTTSSTNKKKTKRIRGSINCSSSSSSISSSSRLTPSTLATRTLAATPTSTALRLLLEFSIVVFLCNFNVGFAVKIEPGHAQSPVLPPYVLDYETAAVGSPGSGRNARAASSDTGHYTHTWAVHIPDGDNGIADAVAKEHGFVNLGKIFNDHYHFAHHKVSKRSLTPALHHQTRLDSDERVHWAKQQRAKSRSKRDFIRMRPSRTSARSRSVDTLEFNDQKWQQMWYLNRGHGLDMNVAPAWKEGITGKGVVVTILDDGLESDHPDIEENYDPKASYDVNSHDDDPMPHYDMADSNRHGTRCAGEVAAVANNSFCAVGIAYEARVGGVRMLDGDVTDAVEARSLSLNPQHIDIYSASWGPDDDGKTVDGPGELASRAFIEGTTKGRGGKGSIFIWASGNGGREMDNCNCDGYTNSIWTLSISSATEEGNVPWYSEKCSSTLATTYSSGGQVEKQVVTTDLHHSCTVSHTGTSASAPLAAGIAALVLQSNQNLTWRDLQHIVVRTAKPANLKDPSWTRNGVGRRVSHSFGYGLMDAADMVRLARKWKTVPEQQRCEINAPHVDKAIPARTRITLQLSVNHCRSVNYLEHVQAKITLTSQRRGDIQLYLRSPANTRVTLLTSRIHDNSRSGFNQWPFMSVHTWGESPHGNWQLEVHNEGRYMGHAVLREWSLIFYGTTMTIDPNDPISVPRAGNDEQSTTPNTGGSGSTTTTLHQIYSPQYPRISPNNFAQTPSGGAKLPLGKAPPNKSNSVTNNPLLQSAPAKQGYQQISATYGILLGKASTASNNNSNNNSNGNTNSNSNNKGNNKGNNKANKGGNGKGSGKGNNRKEQTSQGSSNSSSNSSSGGSGGGGGGGSNKNKYYRISQQHGGGGGGGGGDGGRGGGGGKSKGQANGLQTQRPKASSSEKFYEEKARKVIGEITNSNGNGNGNGNNNGRGSSNNSNGGRQPGGKAAKQVKDNSQDSRIPKLFEHYEKIQAIFPELEPYESISQPKGRPATVQQQQQQQTPRKQGKQFEVELFRPTTGVATGSGSKPGNTKKSPSAPPPPSQSMLPAGGSSFLPDQRILKKQQLLMAAAGVLAPQDDVENVSGKSVSAPASNERNDDDSDDSEESELQLAPSGFRKGSSPNAQITQFDLIFYGTEQPAQAEDQPHEDPKGQFNLYNNDMAHNDIEYDASGQWRNMQQVGEVGIAQDRSNADACLKWSGPKCLDCQEPTYFYQDLCYNECPQHSYPEEHADELDMDIQTLDATGTDSTPDIISDLQKTTQSTNHDQDDPLQAAERRRRRHSSDSSDSSTLVLTPRHSRICSSCDKSCLRCYGPSVSQCSTCYPGSQLRKLPQTNETYCYAYVVRSTVMDISNSVNGELSEASQTQYMSWTTALLVIAVVVSLVGVGVAGGMAYHRRTVKAEVYTRVALIADDDDDSDEEHNEELFNVSRHQPSDVLEYHDELKPIQLPSESLQDERDEEHDEP